VGSISRQKRTKSVSDEVLPVREHHFDTSILTRSDHCLFNPRRALTTGALLVLVGYGGLSMAYGGSFGNKAPIFFLALFSLSTGLGNCAAFTAAMNAQAKSWGEERVRLFGLHETSPSCSLLTCFISSTFREVFALHSSYRGLDYQHSSILHYLIPCFLERLAIICFCLLLDPASPFPLASS
jgi:hypothetical protein